MPSLEHNSLIEMFRENPSLAVHLLETLFHRDVPPHASVRVADSGLDQLIPVEFRADLMLELRAYVGDDASRSLPGFLARGIVQDDEAAGSGFLVAARARDVGRKGDRERCESLRSRCLG